MTVNLSQFHLHMVVKRSMVTISN
uniref:Uncharacterized protein n=1 Tax=Anguilla anguilla TaxID=7936 RepID=A0A0E9S3C1_ANGAN